MDKSLRAELYEFLLRIEYELDQRTDVDDGPYGEPSPNWAMSLGQELEPLLKRLDMENEPVDPPDTEPEEPYKPRKVFYKPCPWCGHAYNKLWAHKRWCSQKPMEVSND